MSENRTARGSEVCIRLPDESYSDAAIHEAIMAGVDDSDIRTRTHVKLLAAGISLEHLDKVLPRRGHR